MVTLANLVTQVKRYVRTCGQELVALVPAGQVGVTADHTEACTPLSTSVR